MSAVNFVYDTRERSIKDTLIAEFSKPHNFAKTKGTIVVSEKQLPVADYVIILNSKIVAAIERKTLSDYAASFKDGRHVNKAKLLNLRNKCECRIYYIVEGATNPDYLTEYAGIKYQNILASMQDLMISDNIHVITTANAIHTAKTLKMLCESYIRVSDDPAKVVNGPISTIETSPTADFSGDLPNDTRQEDDVVKPNDTRQDDVRAELSFEDTLRKANFTPEEKLKTNRVDAWATIKGVGLQTASIISSKFKLADWITGNINKEDVANFTFNGRKNNNFINAVSSRPNLEMQIAILSSLNGYTVKSATELLNQYSLDDLLNDRDYSHVRLGARATKFSNKKIIKIKEFLN